MCIGTCGKYIATENKSIFINIVYWNLITYLPTLYLNHYLKSVIGT